MVVRFRCSLGVKPVYTWAVDRNRAEAFQNHFLSQAVEPEQKGPISFPQEDGPREFSGISQAFLSRISVGGETHSVCAIYWGQKVKGQSPTPYQNNNKPHPARRLQGHPFCVASFPSHTSVQTQSNEKFRVGGGQEKY